MKTALIVGGTAATGLPIVEEVRRRGYEITIYDDNAKANSGLGDEGKLNAAIQSWSEFKNYAAGIGNQAALQKCEREIADLEARRAG